MGKSPEHAALTGTKVPSEAALEFVRALARWRARLDAAPKDAANENDRNIHGPEK